MNNHHHNLILADCMLSLIVIRYCCHQYRLGASIIVVSIASLSESYSNLLYNPLCVLRSENSTDRPHDWQNVLLCDNVSACY